jgi:hypothetical protein
VFRSPDVHRVGTRRILACPYCDGLQAIPPRPLQLAIGCRRCHRVFRVTEAGAARASDRVDEPVLTPRRRPAQALIDRRVEPADGAGGPAPPRTSGGRLRELLRWLRSTAIAPLALVASAAVHALLTIAESTHTAVRRSLPEGRMKTAGRGASELIRQPRRKAGGARDAPRRSEIVHHQNEGVRTTMDIPFLKRPPTLEALRERATHGITTWLTRFAPGLVPERPDPAADDPSALWWMHQFARDVITSNPLSRSPLSPVQIYLIELALECVDWPTLARDRRLRHLDWSRASLVYPRTDRGEAGSRSFEAAGPQVAQSREDGNDSGERREAARVGLVCPRAAGG